MTVERCVAVLDCKPAALALSAAKSKAPLLRAVLRQARLEVEQWLGVHVPREVNTDADRLSHPEQVGSVIAAAEAAGLRVHHIGAFPPRCWGALRAALAEGPWL